MPARDPFDWPPAEPSDGAEDSIAGQLASRIEALPPAPGDAIDWAATAAAFEREAVALGAHPSAAPLLFEAGRIFEERLGDDAAALHFHRLAFEIDPAFVPNLRACRRLAMDRGEDAFAADVLAAEASVAPDDAARAELLLLRGRLLGALGREADAATVLAQAVALAPASFAAAEEEARTAAVTSDREALADAYVRCARAAADRRLSAHYLSATSALLEEGLGRADRAAALALDAYTLFPEDPLLRSAARRHAERLGRRDVLAKLLRADAEASGSGPAAADAWLSLAHVEEGLGRSEAAVAALERGRQADPADPLVLSELARLREARGAWADACDALEALAASHLARGDAAHVAEAVVAKLRRAEIEEAQLGRTHLAIQCCRDVLAADPGNRAALAALGRLCARAGEWEGLLAAFEAEALAAPDPRERAHRTFRAAEVLEERLLRVDDAIERYREALRIDPDLVPARAALERLYDAEGRWEDLCALLETELAELRAPAERVAQLFRMARLREERLRDLAGAAALYRRILQADPENGVALPALAAVLGRLGDVDELAAVLARQAALATDVRRRVALLQRRAELLEVHFDDPERARAAWEDVHAAVPTHLPALRALGRLHARSGRWEELAVMYRAEADGAATDPAAAADLVQRIGELLERRLGRVDEATAAYREVLTLAPAHLPALRALARIHRARGEDERLFEVLRAQGAARLAPEERAAPLAEAARIAEERLASPALAIDTYEEVLRVAPGFAPALRALDRLYAVQGRVEALAGLRRTAPVAGGDRAERLLSLARLEADRTRDRAAALRAVELLLRAEPEQPAALLLELRLAPEPARRARARVALASTATEPEARAALLAAAALDLRPASARREALARAAAFAPASAALGPEEERRLRLAGDYPALARLLEARREDCTDPAARACWAVGAGGAWELAGEPDRALAAFQAALADAPASLPALRGARALFSQRGDWAAVRQTLQAEASALRDPHGAAAAWLQAGEIAEGRFHDLGAAAADYRAAADRTPLERAPLARLEAALGGADAAALAEVHEARALAQPDARGAAESWLAAARASLDSPDGRDGALAALDRALAARPDLAPALELRARTRAAAGLHEEALADCEACIALGGAPHARLVVHLAAAAICAEGLAAPDRALPHLEAALAIAPESPEALARLAQVQRALGRSAEAAAALRRLVDVPGLPREILLDRLLDLAEEDERLGDRDSAEAVCRRALALEPSHDAALRLLLRLTEASGVPARLAAALEGAAAASRNPALQAEAHARAARLYAASSLGRARAIEHLRAALEVEPDRIAERCALADLLEDIAPLAALDEHRNVIARDPLRLASWAALYRHFERTRAHDRAYVAATMIRWLGSPVPGPSAERLLVEGDRQASSPPPALGREGWELLRAPDDCGPLADVVLLAGDAIAAALAAPSAGRGPPLRAEHRLRRVVAELARALEIPEHELYGGPPGRLEIEPELPWAIRVGSDLARRTTAREQRFLLGRVVARLRTRSCLAEVLPPEALGAWATAAARWALGQARDDELAARLARGLGRRVRRALSGPARALLDGPLDAEAWRAAAARTADRAGLVLCGDLPTALELLLREPGAGAPDRAEAIAAAASRADVRALVAFSASDAHFTLRQRLRVAIA